MQKSECAYVCESKGEDEGERILFHYQIASFHSAEEGKRKVVHEL